MSNRYLLALAVLFASMASGSAQQLAPGPALPGNTGGVGPGSTAVAPGPAGGPLIQQQGPGDVPLAIGSPLVSQPHAHRTHHARHTRNATTLHHLR